MSFNAKNLTFESKEPAFLQRLRAQTSGSNHVNNPSARVHKRRTAEDDEEDEPTYVTEDGTEISSKEFKEMNESAAKGDDNVPEQNNDKNDEGGKKDAELNVNGKKGAAELGTKKSRRKGVKVGQQDEDVEDDKGAVKDKNVNQANEDDNHTTEKQMKKKPAKPVKKKVKLSFGQDDEA